MTKAERGNLWIQLMNRKEVLILDTETPGFAPNVSTKAGCYLWRMSGRKSRGGGGTTTGNVPTGRWETWLPRPSPWWPRQESNDPRN